MLQLIERGFFKSPPIKLSENQIQSQTNPPVQVLRVGKFNHPKYGEFEITRTVLAEMKANFDNKVRGVDICFDYFHDSDKEASGWPTELYLTEEGSELWAKVDWTPLARTKLAEREIRYFSPDFAFKWQDPESGKVYDNVLFGGGLTNRPFVKDMAAIVAAEKEGEQMKLDELEKVVLKLAEEGENLKKEHSALQKAHGELQAKLVDAALPKKAAEEPAAEPDGDECEKPADMEALMAENAELKKKLAEFAEKAKKADEAKALAEKETQFNMLLTEGKACAAQKESFIKGDMTAFVKLSQPVNLEGRGSVVIPADPAGDRDERVLKLAEEKCKANPKLDKLSAIDLAYKEIQ